MSVLIPFAALGVAIVLGMVAAEKAVVMAQGRWRFSLKALMILMAIVSVFLGAVAFVVRM